MQTRELEQFVQARGWQLVDSYLDIGISGSKDKRPELDRLMADAHKRHFDVVAVWRFDRFARSVSHLLRALETFNALGIAFVSLSESLDTHARREDGLYGSWRRRGVGAFADMRTGESGSEECEGEREKTWPAAQGRGR